MGLPGFGLSLVAIANAGMSPSVLGDILGTLSRALLDGAKFSNTSTVYVRRSRSCTCTHVHARARTHTHTHTLFSQATNPELLFIPVFPKALNLVTPCRRSLGQGRGAARVEA